MTQINKIQREIQLDASVAGMRIDQALAKLVPDVSRSCLQQWLAEGKILVDGAQVKQRDKVRGMEIVHIHAELMSQEYCEPQPIPLDIKYEDEHLLVIDKPAGLVVHPAAGNHDGTLQNGLLYYDPSLAMLPRAGIVHRLDKNTSGLLVVARTLAARTKLVADLQAREIHREYRALVKGNLISGGTIDEPIGRHPTNRLRMAVVGNGRPSRTHFRVLANLGPCAWLALKLETGRTHQIRVHMMHIGHPLVGDNLYSKRQVPIKGLEPEVVTALQQFSRQALHAYRLSLSHPITGEWLSWTSELPADLKALLDSLLAQFPKQAEIAQVEANEGLWDKPMLNWSDEAYEEEWDEDVW